MNAKRIYRVYTEEGLQVRMKRRKKIARRQRMPAPIAARPNPCWAMDFVSDRLADGRAFRIFTAGDQFTRECVALQADPFMSGLSPDAVRLAWNGQQSPRVESAR